MPFPATSVVDTIYRGVSLGNLTTQAIVPQWLASSPAGTYNYCAMPHPQKEQYDPLPGKLVYVEYIQRHHKRTPYNLVNGDAFYCDETHQLTGNHLVHSDSPASDLIIETPNNTFTDIRGSCQYPQLTTGGLLDAEWHGRDIWNLYGAQLGLLAVEPDSREVRHRVSNSRLTEATANSLLRGVWPGQSKLPLYQQPADYDTVNAGFSCDRRDALKKAQRQTAEWTAHLNEMHDTLERINGTIYPGAASSDAWTADFDHLCDNFQAKLCNGYDLPVPEDVQTAVFNAGDWEWNYYWTSNSSADYIKSVEGAFIAEIVDRLKTPPQGLKFSHTFAHDGDIGPLAGALGIETLRWPGMGSNIAIEVWENNGVKTVRALYCGAPIRSTHQGLGDGVPLETLLDILEPFTLRDASWCSV